MGFEPEEFGPPEDASSVPEIPNLENVLALAAQGNQIATQMRQQPVRPAYRQAPDRPAYRQAPDRPASQPAVATAPSRPMEIKNRLRLASYYEALLDQPLFGDDDAFSDIVQKEIRQFIENRLGELLGMGKKSPSLEPAAQFTNAEVQALRALAARILAPAPSPAPVVATPPPVVNDGGRRDISVPEQLAEPVVVPARMPTTPSVTMTQAPAAPRVMPAAHPRRRRGAALTAPATETQAASVEVPAQKAAPAPAPAPAPVPQVNPGRIPMPRAQDMTAVTASTAMAAVQALEQQVNKVLG